MASTGEMAAAAAMVEVVVVVVVVVVVKLFCEMRARLSSRYVSTCVASASTATRTGMTDRR